jgi:pyruvate kinase
MAKRNPTTLPVQQRARTKIIATIGPACSSVEKLAELVRCGVDVFRLNMAHGSRAEHEQNLASIRTVSETIGQPIGVLVDLAGPKIRLGELHTNPLTCEMDQEVRFVKDEAASPHELTSNYAPLIDELSPGDRVMLADGTVSLQVERKEPDWVVCRVTGPGELRSRQGINLPGVTLSVPSLTEADLDNARWAAANEIDFISLSFVRTPKELNELKQLVAEAGSDAMIVAKIEKGEALDRLEDIVATADAVMVARGDLGVEIDVAETPVAQKRIIEVCTKLLKPVIVATQMLDGMHHCSRPTRAEASDVANAILDGADACMLSGETAIGEYPVEAVSMMNRIMLATEQMLSDSLPSGPPVAAVSGVHPITAAITFGAAKIAEQLHASMVVVATRTGGTARVKSKQRNFIPTVGVSDSPSTLRKMCLFWGITPLPGAPVDSGLSLRKYIDRWGRANGSVDDGDRIVFVTGSRITPKAHNVIVVHEV